ncbi:MAG: hypothetical protein ACE5G0_00450 [Rhodothermales bacterium]
MPPALGGYRFLQALQARSKVFFRLLAVDKITGRQEQEHDHAHQKKKSKAFHIAPPSEGYFHFMAAS